jgi:RNA polymerase sigma factor (sigma-70 family)
MTTQLPESPAPADPDGPSDAELITATRTGDPGAYDVLYRRHVVAANRLARTLVRDRSAADDLVAEAFARVLATLRAGHGPDLAFRAYLLTSLRNTFYDQTRRERRLEVTDDLTPYDKGVPFQDTASEGLERSLAARAFARLPERWQTVLWHTEVEGESPAAVAPLLGLTPNGVSALAYRARERLRQMYLQEHIADTADPGCHWTAERLGAHVRDGLSSREKEHVDAHLADCAKCKLLFVELAQVNSGLREVLAPIVVGTTWAAYLGIGTATKGAAVGLAGAFGWLGLAWRSVVGWATAALLWVKALALKSVAWVKALFVKVGPRNSAIGGGATAAVVAAVVAALLLTSGNPKPHAANPPPTRPATQPPGNPPANNPPKNNPPATQPTNPTKPRATTPAPAKPTPGKPATPAGYKITSPSLSVGGLTAGDTAGSLPITITNPSTGGTGGGDAVANLGGTPTSPTPGTTEAATTEGEQARQTGIGTTGSSAKTGTSAKAAKAAKARTGRRVPHPAPGPEITPPGGSPVPGLDHPAVSGPGSFGVPGVPGATPSTGPSGLPGNAGPSAPTASGPPAGAGPLLVTVTLPAPMVAGSSGNAGSGWTCAAVSGGARCRHAMLAAGASTTLTLSVSVGDVSGFQPVTVALSGSGTGRATFTVVVAPSGMHTIYAATAADTIATAGNTLVTGRQPGLLLLKGKECQLNDDCSVQPYHGDRSGYDRDPDDAASSRAQLVVPAGSTVVRAELYWSGRGSSGTMPGSVTLTGPAASGGTVSAGSSTAIPYGAQRSADVTSLVARGGAGYWTLSARGVPTGVVPGGAYAGWGLVVVLSTPGTTVRNVALFDGPTQVSAPVTSRLTGGRGGVQVGVVLWDGDRRQPGGLLGDDTLSIGTSDTVTDVGHSYCASAPEDRSDPDWNTLGTDVATYGATASGDTRMRLSTGSDKFLLGGLALAGPA